MDSGASSSDESIFHEQTKKLYRICDVDGNGTIGKNDLDALVELVPPDDLFKIRRFIGDQRVNESAFCRILKTIVSQSMKQAEEQMVNDIITNKEVFSRDRFIKGMTLEAELNEADVDPLGANDSDTENIRDIETLNNIIIKKPLYRPIQPESSIPKVSSLAQELHDLEHNSPKNESETSSPTEEELTPDRIFKVVFVGDSAVGKTCFLHRFCHNRFKPLFNATIGVDFTVKTMKISPNRSIAMQLWDTAGQERFRSITKQYFRKADGVVLMFDVTSEQSFLNVRNWIDSVKAGVDETSVMCLVGNKVDLFGNDQTRNSVYRAGIKLAQEFDIKFFETSAYTGFGIDNCMRQMAESLQQREDNHLERALKLDLQPNMKTRSWCCI